MSLDAIIGDDMQQFLRILAALFTVFHVLVGLILLRFTVSAGDVVKLPGSRLVKAVSFLHVSLLAGILVFVILF